MKLLVAAAAAVVLIGCGGSSDSDRWQRWWDATPAADRATICATLLDPHVSDRVVEAVAANAGVDIDEAYRIVAANC